MTTSIGYALGAGSGIDIRALVENLSSATKAPKEALIVRREQANQASISALAEMAGSIDGFASALSTLIAGGSLSTQPTVSDPSLAALSAVPGARIGPISAQLEVMQLAQAQTLQSAALADRNAAVGQGELTLTTSRGSFAITIDDGNDSLDGLAKAINAANGGVQASIVTDPTGARLVLKGGTGAAEAFTLSVPDGTAGGLERFAFGPGVVGGMTSAQTAQDAIVRMDGVEVRRSSNSFKDLIEGVQIDLKRAAPGSLLSIGISRPTAAIEQALGDFIAAYNALMTMIGEVTAPGAAGEAGALRGNLGIREMQRQLRELTATPLVSQGDGPRTLAEVGVRTNRDGSLSLDAGRLKSMLETNPAGVEALFNPSQFSSHASLIIKSSISRVKPGTYHLTDLVPPGPDTPASGKIDGVAAISSGLNIVGPVGSKAVGLIVGVTAPLASATVTIEPGLGGALAGIRDMLRAGNGPFASAEQRLKKEATAIARDREALELRSEAYEAQLLNNFTAMERQVSAFKATQSYLEQQIKIWTADRG